MGYKNPDDPRKKVAEQKRYEKQKASGFAYRRNYRHSIQRFLTEYKTGKPCTDCGGTFPTFCMDFDHRDPATKTAKLSRLAQFSMKKLLIEIEKCDLICSNCHRIRTFTRNPLRHLQHAA